MLFYGVMALSYLEGVFCVVGSAGVGEISVTVLGDVSASLSLQDSSSPSSSSSSSSSSSAIGSLSRLRFFITPLFLRNQQYLPGLKRTHIKYDPDSAVGQSQFVVKRENLLVLYFPTPLQKNASLKTETFDTTSSDTDTILILGRSRFLIPIRY